MTRLIRPGLVLAGLALVLGIANLEVAHRQGIVDGGRRVLVELMPVDPRSMLQGDYMRLRFSDDAMPPRQSIEDMDVRGTVVMRLDPDGVARFARVDDGGALAADEVRLEYRRQSGRDRLKYGSESLFFEEGQGERYSDAEYGVLRVDEDGTSVLVGLADGDRQVISNR